MKNIIIDCDPGHDDALAILTALASPEQIRILGITTVGGNQTLEKVTRNAGNILNFVHGDVPLASGQEKPLNREPMPAPEAHGDSGMDGPYFEDKEYPCVSDNAVVFMRELIMGCEEKVTIAALGPLTNVALLLKTFPEVKDRIQCISLMGGGLDHGNCTPLAEFNIYVDPEAAHLVYHAGIPVVMAGLDVTEQAVITVEEIEQLREGGRVSRLAYELLSYYNKTGRQFGFTDSPLHDLCAVAYLLEPEIFRGKDYYVDIVTDEGMGRGMTFADKRRVCPRPSNVYVLLEVDRSRLVSMLQAALEKLDLASL